MQEKQKEWQWQWDQFYDDNQLLFTEWISPNTLEDFRGKDVLDCGCGGGQHLSFITPYCKSAVGVDLNATDSAVKHTAQFPHIKIVEADLATMDLGQTFDIVYCIGVLHHTDNPDVTFRNIARHCRSGGRVIVWVYSREGNFLNRTVVEGSKHLLIFHLPRPIVRAISWILTALVSIPVYTIYLLPLTFFFYFH